MDDTVKDNLEKARETSVDGMLRIARYHSVKFVKALKEMSFEKEGIVSMLKIQTSDGDIRVRDLIE